MQSQDPKAAQKYLALLMCTAFQNISYFYLPESGYSYLDTHTENSYEFPRICEKLCKYTVGKRGTKPPKGGCLNDMEKL